MGFSGARWKSSITVRPKLGIDAPVDHPDVHVLGGVLDYDLDPELAHAPVAVWLHDDLNAHLGDASIRSVEDRSRRVCKTDRICGRDGVRRTGDHRIQEQLAGAVLQFVTTRTVLEEI